MHGTCGLINPWHHLTKMSSWVGNPCRPSYVIPRGSAGLKKKGFLFLVLRTRGEKLHGEKKRLSTYDGASKLSLICYFRLKKMTKRHDISSTFSDFLKEKFIFFLINLIDAVESNFRAFVFGFCGSFFQKLTWPGVSLYLLHEDSGHP